MNPIRIAAWALGLGVASVLASSPAAQDHVRSHLFTRVDGDVVRAAIQVDLDRGWHFYHSELGHPEAIGKPTMVSFGGGGIRWSDVRFPAPVRHDQGLTGADGSEIWIWIHEGRPVLYAAGRVDPGGDPAELVVHLEGLVCSEQCLPWSESLESEGAGPDALFASFPADLLPPESRAAPRQEREDEHGGGHADATLYTRVEDGVVRAAIEFELDRGWHLYHDDLGNPEAIGKPTRVTLGGEGVTWGAARFPAPEKAEQVGLTDSAGEPLWIYQHGGRFVVYAAGVVDGAAPRDLHVEVAGLTCEDDGQCVPYNETAWSRGAGPDALFASFPADLSPQRGPPAPEAREDELEPREDELEIGHADATLYHRLDGRTVQVAVEVAIDPHWHLYHSDIGHPQAAAKPTRVTFTPDSVTWGPVRFPEPERAGQGFDDDEGNEIWVLQHAGTIVLRAEGELPAGMDAATFERELSVSVDGLTCEEGGQCVPYRETAYSHGAGDDALFAAAVGAGDGGGAAADAAATPSDAGASRDVSTAASTKDAVRDASLGKFLLMAVLWGLFTLLMPCTYPMIPITVSFFTKQADARGGNVLPLSLAYGFGIVLVFVLIGVLVGPIVIRFATHWATNAVIAAAFLYFSLVLFGFVQLNPPRALMNLAGKASMTGGYLGVFLMGATLVITSFTCTAPFVGSLLGFGAESGDLTRVVLGMGVFGLTVAVPFVFLSLVPGRIQAMPKSGMWMNTLKCALGFVELAASFKFISNVDLGLGWFTLSYELFLFIWAAIFLGLAWYLIAPRSKQAIGGKRRFAGALAAVFAVYVAWGGAGHKLDPVMMSMAPPYSGGRLLPILYERDFAWTLVKDDYDEAVRVARAEDKLLLVNFTGFL